MPIRRGATTVTANRGPHLVDGNGAVITGGGVSDLTAQLPPRNSHTRFVNDLGRLRRRDLKLKK